jgi:hypothetical protein
MRIQTRNPVVRKYGYLLITAVASYMNAFELFFNPERVRLLPTGLHVHNVYGR